MPLLLLVTLLLIVDAEVPSHGRYQDTRLEVISEPPKRSCHLWKKIPLVTTQPGEVLNQPGLTRSGLGTDPTTRSPSGAQNSPRSCSKNRLPGEEGRPLGALSAHSTLFLMGSRGPHFICGALLGPQAPAITGASVELEFPP